MALPPQQRVDHVQGARERSRRWARLGPAVPATIRHLVGHEPLHHRVDVDAQVGTDQDRAGVDAAVHLAGEERQPVVLPAAVAGHQVCGLLHHRTVRGYAQVAQVEQDRVRRGPRLARLGTRPVGRCLGRFRLGRRERRRWLTGSQRPRRGRSERRGTRKAGPVRPQAIRSPHRQQPSTPALVLHPRSLGRHLGLRGVDEVAQHLPADRRIALQQPLHNRIVLGHRRRSWLVRALILRRLHP